MIEISEKELLDLIHWARRYCDGRSTHAPSSFNKIYLRLWKKYPKTFEKDHKDTILMGEGKFFPYAQDGMYDEETCAFNAMPKILKNT